MGHTATQHPESHSLGGRGETGSFYKLAPYTRGVCVCQGMEPVKAAVLALPLLPAGLQCHLADLPH